MAAGVLLVTLMTATPERRGKTNESIGLLIPTKVNKLGWPEAVTIGHQDYRCVPMLPTVLSSGVHEPFDLRFRQVLSRAQVNVWRPPGRDCSFYGSWRHQLEV